LLGRYQDAVARADAQLANADLQLADANLALARGEAALEQFAAWQDRSLPANPNVAKSLYRTWLIEQLNAAQLRTADIAPEPSTRRSRAYETLAFRIDAVGSLERLTDFLYAFYRSDQLHKLTYLRLTPTDASGDLRIELKVEALILQGSTNTEKLSELVSDRLALESVEAYRDVIGGRNIFRPYEPPRPVVTPVVAEKSKEEAKPKFDDAAHAYVTGIVQAGGQLQVWVTVRTTGETLRLHQGDAIKVGLLEGQVAEIHPREIVVESGGERTLVSLGQNLREGQLVPPSSEI
jgi:hypothetical protein